MRCEVKPPLPPPGENFEVKALHCHRPLPSVYHFLCMRFWTSVVLACELRLLILLHAEASLGNLSGSI